MEKVKQSECFSGLVDRVEKLVVDRVDKIGIIVGKVVGASKWGRGS